MHPTRMTLNEAANALGIKPQSVRSRFKAGKIKGERDNSGKIWVWLDGSTPANQRRSKPPLKQLATEGEIAALKAHVSALTAELATLRPKASEADRLTGEIRGLNAMIDAITADRDEWRMLAQRLTEARQSIWKRIFRP